MLETVSVVRVCKVRISLFFLFIVKTEVEIKSWVKRQLGFGKLLQKYYSPCGRSNPKFFFRPQIKTARICEWASGYLQPWYPMSISDYLQCVTFTSLHLSTYMQSKHNIRCSPFVEPFQFFLETLLCNKSFQYALLHLIWNISFIN